MQLGVTTWGPATLSWGLRGILLLDFNPSTAQKCRRRNSKFLSGDTSQTGLHLAIPQILLLRPTLVSRLVCAGYRTTLPRGPDLVWCLVTSSTHPVLALYCTNTTTQRTRIEPPSQPPSQPIDQPTARASRSSHPTHVLCHPPT